jgi:hypothetical protein
MAAQGKVAQCEVPVQKKSESTETRFWRGLRKFKIRAARDSGVQAFHFKN